MNPHPSSDQTGAAPVAVPMNVWLCADPTAGVGGEQGGPVQCPRHGTAIGRRLADQMVGYLTRPGDLVVDAYGASTTLSTAAVRGGRRAVLLAADAAAAAWLNIQLPFGLTAAQLTSAEVRAGGSGAHPGRLSGALADLQGRIGLLVATAPRLGDPPARPIQPGGRAEIQRPHADALMKAARRLLKPGGVLAVLLPGTYSTHCFGGDTSGTGGPGRLGRLVRIAAGHHLLFIQHIIAIQAPVTGGRFVIDAHPGCPDCVHEQADPTGVVTVHASIALFTSPLPHTAPHPDASTRTGGHQ